MKEAFIAALAVFVFLIALYFLLDYRKRKKEWRKDVQNFYLDGEKRKSIIVLIGTKFDETQTAKEMEPKLSNANIPFTPSEFIGAMIVAYMGVVFGLVNFFQLSLLPALLVGLLLIEGSRRLLFILRKNKKKQMLIDQLPEICRVLANSTRSGMTLNQGIQLITQDISEPAKSEFKRLAHELSLGIEFSTVIRAMEKRVDHKEFQLFTATLLIQKKAGGNLSAVLDEMSQTLDERMLLKQEVKTMTAEQKYVSTLIPLIPIFLVLMMNNIIDGFLDPLFSGIGLILLAFFLCGTILTFVIVRKITNIRV
ncbi:type II secretion system F family protein [Sporosarcina oncorhynchi]|uniref:Type II secretion system F family protein n=1 Tax=Sporosarcina oncorhynchi TaxID=3056444 RepID=A0ABZ0L6Q4_9BACL|nr:type II secretion system F family protein [Sporosarcina sp. T2O-4]WOV88246.1 type II secretion system F family protein [Sporosarcina sp. T2O-4]